MRFLPLVLVMACAEPAVVDDHSLPGETTVCFGDGGAIPRATLEYVLEVFEGVDSVHVRLTLDPRFVDNTYGATAVGWAAHTFAQLVGSDHAELVLTDGDGADAVQLRLDYISKDGAGGYRSNGVADKDGEMILGDAADVIAWSTSMERNLNERGYGAYTEDSPATTADYAPHPDAPDWEFRVVYEAWIAAAAFGDVGFGDARVDHIHASPAKDGDNTVIVWPTDCPPDWDTTPPYVE